MVSADAVVACITFFLIGLFAGAAAHMAADGTVKRWLELRHELRMKVLAQRERWLEADATRPRAGEYRTETRETPRV